MEVVLTINGKKLVFDIDDTTYEKCINEMNPGNKTAPQRNFLMRSITSESKEDLKAIITHPAAVQQIFPQVMEGYIPDLEITVGESKDEPDK